MINARDDVKSVGCIHVTRLILASRSPARLKTLRAAGIEPIVRPSGVDEDAAIAEAVALHGTLNTSDTALILARTKAEAVSHETPGDVLVLGCDSVLDIDSMTHGKPTDADDATRRWRAMRGQEGTLYTGHWLIDRRVDGTGKSAGASAATTVRFADLSDDEIVAYVATGEPLEVAGAFTVDGLGGPFVTAIEGDFHNVVGVSLPLLRNLVAEFDLAITDLWRPTPSGRQA
jgi:septum formation protein